MIEHLKEESKIEVSDDIIETVKNINHEEPHQRSVIELRENFQYGTETSIKDETLSKFKELCKRALEEAKSIIY